MRRVSGCLAMSKHELLQFAGQLDHRLKIVHTRTIGNELQRNAHLRALVCTCMRRLNSGPLPAMSEGSCSSEKRVTSTQTFSGASLSCISFATDNTTTPIRTPPSAAGLPSMIVVTTTSAPRKRRPMPTLPLFLLPPCAPSCDASAGAGADLALNHNCIASRLSARVCHPQRESAPPIQIAARSQPLPLLLSSTRGLHFALARHLLTTLI